MNSQFFKRNIELTFFTIVILLTACQRQSPEIIKTDDYWLLKAPRPSFTSLVLFDGYGGSPEDILRQLPEIESLPTNGINVILMDLSDRLWLEDDQKTELEQFLEITFEEHRLLTQKIVLGGFSSGGNVALLLANHLKVHSLSLQLGGVFVVDSPVDLHSLSNTANYLILNTESAQKPEAEMVKGLIEETFGIGDSSLIHYQYYSPAVLKTSTLTNLKNLQGIPIRFYTEPDTSWWELNRSTPFEHTNAYRIFSLVDTLSHHGFEVELILTEEKGRRADGKRHPHSWSIVDVAGLQTWIQGDN